MASKASTNSKPSCQTPGQNPALSKQQLLLSLAKPEIRHWDDLIGAWNDIYEFLKPRLRFQVFDPDKYVDFPALKKLRSQWDFPNERISAARLSNKDVGSMIRSIYLHYKNNDWEQFDAPIFPKTERGDVHASNYCRHMNHSADPIQYECLMSLSRSQDRKWDDLVKSWDALHAFIKPRLHRRVTKLPSDERLEKWRCKSQYPFEQVLRLNLSTKEVNMLMRSVCQQISSMKLDSDQTSDQTAKKQDKRSRDDETSNTDVAAKADAPPEEPKRNRTRTNQQMSSLLPITTKVYFMEEAKPESRTGVLVSLLSYAKPENNCIDIGTLRFGNAIRHLAKRSEFDKSKHEIFYYDLENPSVRINVDSVTSFRAAVQEIFTYGESEPQIQFCFRKKEELKRDSEIGPFNPPSGPRSQSQYVDRYRPRYERQ